MSARLMKRRRDSIKAKDSKGGETIEKKINDNCFSGNTGI